MRSMPKKWGGKGDQNEELDRGNDGRPSPTSGKAATKRRLRPAIKSHSGKRETRRIFRREAPHDRKGRVNNTRQLC